MATMNISLPDPMRDWVEQQIQGGRYSNNSDYVRDLIRRDQELRDKTLALQQAITKGLESGLDGKLDMDEIKRLARAQAQLNSDS
ncbi:type II toxin-antitoxin system ParD family antitoxin [Aliikangiella maris]|uniref:Type II toxin-antitoxin system ParD family antitoxin n=2 Tax=Aliikangiella maris TaxID=3162458 RepID=A0ABV2BUW4_9GAMM